MSRRRQQNEPGSSSQESTRYQTDPQLLAAEIAEPVGTYGGASSESLPLAVARRIFEQLDELETRYGQQGRSLADLGSAEHLAERMLATVPTPSPWSELGPFYSTTGVARLLGGISRQAIADRRQRGTLIGLRTADDAWVYPEFQFDHHQTVLRDLPATWKILRASGVDEWTLAGWLTSPVSKLGDCSPIDWLRRGEDREVLFTLARDATQRFSR